MRSPNGKITADAQALIMPFPGRARRARVGITEGEPIVNIITDCLDPLPARRDFAKQRPSRIGQTIGFAVAAAEKEFERVVWKIFDGELCCIGFDPIWLAAVGDNVIGRNDKSPCWRNDAGTDIAEMIIVRHTPATELAGQR